MTTPISPLSKNLNKQYIMQEDENKKNAVIFWDEWLQRPDVEGGKPFNVTLYSQRRAYFDTLQLKPIQVKEYQRFTDISLEKNKDGNGNYYLPTAFGISFHALYQYNEKCGKSFFMDTLTKEQAFEIYYKNYYVATDDKSISFLLTECKWGGTSKINNLQIAINKLIEEGEIKGEKLVPDGVIGEKTKNILINNKEKLIIIYKKMIEIRTAQLKQLSTWALYGKGWTKRFILFGDFLKYYEKI